MTAAGRGRASAALAHRHTLAELLQLETILTANRANHLPDGSLRPAVARKVRNLRLAMQYIQDGRPRATARPGAHSRRNP